VVAQFSVCVCSPHYPPTASGVGDYTYFLANAIAEMGCSVEVLTSVGEPASKLYAPHPGVEVHRVVKSWGVEGVAHILAAVRALRSNTILLQYAPHAYGRWGMTLGVNLLPAAVRAATGKRVILNFHELFIPFDHVPRHVLGALWQRAMAFLIGVSSNSVTAVSSEWPRRLRRVGIHGKVRVIPVGSNIPRADLAPDERQRIRLELGTGRDGLLVGCLGATGPHGDVVLLKEALRKARGQCALTAVWLGRTGLNTRGLDEDGVTWTGPLPHPEISRTMSSCDIFVLPFGDGVSTKRTTLAAALLHELPVLSTSGERVDRIFVHGQNIYLASSGDSEALAKGLVELGQSVELRGHLARGARALYQAHFAWEVIARQVVQEIDQLCRRSTPR
jgi:glycosyltransferase involved in cell wall biosynthesis